MEQQQNNNKTAERKIINGIMVCVGKKGRGCSFTYHKDNNEAEEQIKIIKTQIERKEGIFAITREGYDTIWTEERLLTKCPMCDRLMEESEALCLRCDDIMMDAMMNNQEEEWHNDNTHTTERGFI